MARELEKLRAEMANTEKRARTAAVVGNPGYSCHYYSIYLGENGSNIRGLVFAYIRYYSGRILSLQIMNVLVQGDAGSFLL